MFLKSSCLILCNSISFLTHIGELNDTSRRCGNKQNLLFALTEWQTGRVFWKGGIEVVSYGRSGKTLLPTTNFIYISVLTLCKCWPWPHPCAAESPVLLYDTGRNWGREVKWWCQQLLYTSGLIENTAVTSQHTAPCDAKAMKTLGSFDPSLFIVI